MRQFIEVNKNGRNPFDPVRLVPKNQFSLYSIALSDSTMLIFSSYGRMMMSTQNANTNVSATEKR